MDTEVLLNILITRNRGKPIMLLCCFWGLNVMIDDIVISIKIDITIISLKETFESF